MRFHAEMLLVAILDLAHLGGALAILVLGRTRRGNQRGADYRAFLGQAWSRNYPDGAGIAPNRIRTSQYESEACSSCLGDALIHPVWRSFETKPTALLRAAFMVLRTGPAVPG